ncbi:thioredoxin-like domain-containing protein [Cladorrhinum sp. PSN259]|nr:thioredoxin-like domain-containing protein [Cladorrhinum sp. PSN259]
MARYNKKKLLLSLLGLVATPVKAWDHVADSGELSRIIKLAEQPILVAFVKENEKASTALETEWTNAVSSASPDQNLLSIDCSKPETEKDCALQKQMPAYPSIWLLEKERPPVQYRGAKRSDAFLHYLYRKSRQPVTEVTDEEELKTFKVSDETVFVAYLSKEDREGREEFEDVARAFEEEFSFGIVLLDDDDDNAAASEQEQQQQPGTVVAYKLVDGDTVVRKGGIGDDVKEFEGWVKTASRPVISELTVLNRERLLERGWPMVYLFGSTEAERQKLRKTLYKFARDYYESLTTVIANPFDWPNLMENLGLDPTAFPAGAVHQLSKDRIYPYPKGQPLTPGAIQNWGMDIYNGRVKPWTRPGAVPASNEDVKPTTRKAATRKISMVNNIPGVKIKIAGRDEL